MNENKIIENKMGVRPIPGLLLSMSVPAICSMTLQSIYNVVDSLYVSRLGEQALAAVTLVFPIQMFVISLAVGTGIGLNSLISRRLGERNYKEANSAANHGFVLAILSWILFLIFGLFLTRPFFEWYTESESLVSMATSYGSIVSAGSIFLFIQVTGEKILQATGNMVIPMVSNLLGCITNIILDPIMIFGYFGFPALGVAGAAIATIIGQIVGMTAILIFVIRLDHDIHISLKGFRLNTNIIKNIYAVGFPAIIMQSILSVAIIFLNMLLIAFSEVAVAVLGVYFRLQSFIFMPVFGLTQGAMPILGYNFGARNKSRYMHTFKLTLAVSIFIMSFGFLLFQIFPGQLMDMFDPSAEMKTMGIKALRMISVCFIPAAASIIISTSFQSTGHGFYSLAMSLLRQIIFLLPFAYVLSRFYGIEGVLVAYPLAEVLSLLYGVYLFIRVYGREIKNLDEPRLIDNGMAL